VNQQHALVVQPDAAVAAGDVQARHQIGHVGKAHFIYAGLIGLHDG